MYENRIAHGNKTGELHNLVIDSPPEVTADANTSDTFTPWARMLDPGRTLLAAWEGVISSAINPEVNLSSRPRG
jgi:hypothetical protein